MDVAASAWGNLQPIQLSVTAEAVASASAEARSLLGSGRCGGAGAGYVMRR